MTNHENTSSLAAFTLGTLIPLIDTSALFGAIAGSVFYIMIDTNTPIIKRLIFMTVSFLCGYLWAQPVSAHYGVPYVGFAAFLISLLLTVFSVTIIDKVRNADLINFIRGIFKK